MREWWTVADLAGIAGMPATASGVLRYARKGGWASRKRAVGKGLEYHFKSLPVVTQNYLIHLEADRIAAEAHGGGLALGGGPRGTAHPTAHQSGELTAMVPGLPGLPGLPGNPGTSSQSSLHPEPSLGMVATRPGEPAVRRKDRLDGATTGSALAAQRAGAPTLTPNPPAPSAKPLVKPAPGAPAPRVRHAEARALAALEDDERPVVNAHLTDWQRGCRDARLLLLSWVDDLSLSLGSQADAIDRVLELAALGQMPAPYAAALALAHERQGQDRSLSRGTLYRWISARREGPDALAPATRAPRPHPPWIAPLLTLYQDPRKPSVAACWRRLREIASDDLTLPSLRCAETWLNERLPAAITQWGRMGTRARRAIKPFVRRTTDGLWPMDIVAVDGHCFKAWVAHPLSGERYRPEITTYLDLATRRIVGCSAWVAESQYAIWLALRAMVSNPHQGIPALHYSDNGAYTGDQHRALLARLGIDQTHSLPGNPQANGAIERINRSVWLPAAKQLALYAGKDMDKDAFKTRKDQADKTGAGVMAWADFTDFIQREIRAYNGREHASLTRHRTRLSPDHAWAEAVAEGWQPTLLDGDDLHDLLPSEQRTCRRGEVRLPWGRYYSRDLDDYHGQVLRVGYDPLDGAQVWVSDPQGRLITTAKRDGNARPYVAATALEDARAKREAARIKRLEARIERVQAQEAAVIDLRPVALDPQQAQVLADLPYLRLPQPGEWVVDHSPLPELPTVNLREEIPLVSQRPAQTQTQALPQDPVQIQTQAAPAPAGGDSPAATPAQPQVQRRPDHEIRMDLPLPGLDMAPVLTLPGRHGIHYLDRLESDPERYQHWLRLKAAAAAGQDLDARESAFVTAFAASDYCRITEQLFADFNARLAGQEERARD